MVDDLLHYDYAPYLPDLPGDKIVCVVAKPICIDSIQGLHCLMTIPFNVPFRFQGRLDANMVSYSLMRVRIANPGKTPLLVQEDCSMIWGHPQCNWDDVLQVTELCAGMGGMSQGAKASNFVPVVACEIRPRMAELYKLNCDAEVVVGDITKLDVLQKIYTAHPRTTTLAAGVSCQPYSLLGDGKSGDDPRAQTLPAALAAAHFLRSMAIVLECVEPAGSDAFVRWHVDQFCSRTGFHKSETILHLHDVWPCKRSRWWCILTAPLVGKVDLRPFPSCTDLKTVRDVLPQTHRWSDKDERLLKLTAIELEAFMGSTGNCANYLLNFAGTMPCALHAWGSQMLPCPCGCRSQGLSMDRIKHKGLHGVLVRSVPLDGDESDRHCHYRHLHPQEGALMCGMDPCLVWGKDPRLSLSGIGQIASPVQALWVFQHLLRQLHFLKLGEWAVKPHAALLAYRSWLLARARVQWNFPIDRFVPSEALHMSTVWKQREIDTIDDLLSGPIALVDQFALLQQKCKDLEADESVLGDSHTNSAQDLTVSQVAIPSQTETCKEDLKCYISLKFQHIGREALDPAAEVLVPVGTTVQELLVAELDFQGIQAQCRVEKSDGEEVDTSKVITENNSFVFVLGYHPSPPAAKSSDTHEVAVEVSPLLKVKSQGFLNLQGPQVGIAAQATSLRAQTMLGSDRIVALQNQGLVWGDDEIIWHLAQIQHQWVSGESLGDAKPQIIDPLLAHGWTLMDATNHIHDWLADHSMPSLVCTAVLHQKHWIPLVVQIQNGQLEVSFIRSQPSDEKCIGHLVAMFIAALPHMSSDVVPVDFVDNIPSCGAHAIAFIRHIILGEQLPLSSNEIFRCHEKFRQAFEAAVAGAWIAYHPWMWGAGNGQHDKAIAALKPILKEQGVNPDHLQSRCAQAVKSCGAEDILNACNSKTPWRSLKAVGNNVKFQFLLPSELQEKISKKAGHEVEKKPKGGKKPIKTFKPEEPIQLDPAKLSLPEGTFHCDNRSLHQIQISQVGPLSEGVVVTTAADAEPYLKANKFVSTGPLALLILNAPNHAWNTTLPHVALTVPARCVLNSEPLLLHATLVQIGHGQVEKAVVKTSPQVDSVQVATVKATVYRDEVAVSWETFIGSPVKFVLQQLPCLQLCTEPKCSCECWHNHEKEPIQTAVVDVWRRQFMRAGFKPEHPKEATIFSVCLRIPRCLLERVLAYSGVGGTYLEPRTLDSRDVDRTFDIVWVPKADKTVVQHLKQTNPATIGLARVGDRYGLRVKSDQAEHVHQTIRPDVVFLPQGPRLQFSATPIPYGTDRQALSKVLKSFGWEAKPIQPIGSVAGKGNTWMIFATCPPPSNILSMSHGDVVVSTIKAPDVAKQSDVKPVAATATLSLCGQVVQQHVKKDPWVVADPWQNYQGPKVEASSSHVPEAQASLRQLETKIEQAVLARIPVQPTAMDQDDVSDRVGDLEKQVQVLMNRQQSLETAVQENGIQQSAQFTQLQGQLNAQSQQFAGQLASQQQNMQHLFESQMAQIRNLLTKRPRDGEGE